MMRKYLRFQRRYKVNVVIIAFSVRCAVVCQRFEAFLLSGYRLTLPAIGINCLLAKKFMQLFGLGYPGPGFSKIAPGRNNINPSPLC